MIVEKAVKGRTDELMVKWMEEVLLPEAPHIKYLVLDRAFAHTAKIVQEYVKKRNLTLLYLPAKTAPSLSPLDNEFFAPFKSKLQGFHLSGAEKKKSAAVQIYDDIPAETVRKYFISYNLLHIEDIVEDDTDCYIISEIFDTLSLT